MNKEDARQWLKKRRANLSQKRRDEASFALFETFASSSSPILSFMSIQTEISTHLLNLQLAKRGHLLLPKVTQEGLEVYEVYNCAKQLAPGFFDILEPIPTLCKKIEISQLERVLVPGLGFDRHRNRIGYGKGFYDRLLVQLKFCAAFGIGFTEQLVEVLPIEESDQPLQEILLF